MLTPATNMPERRTLFGSGIAKLIASRDSVMTCEMSLIGVKLPFSDKNGPFAVNKSMHKSCGSLKRALAAAAFVMDQPIGAANVRKSRHRQKSGIAGGDKGMQNADACACGIPSVEWGEAVGVALVVREGHPQPSEDEIRDLVRTRLRSSRVPERILFVKELPYNEMGKLLRREVKNILAG